MKNTITGLELRLALPEAHSAMMLPGMDTAYAICPKSRCTYKVTRIIMNGAFRYVVALDAPHKINLRPQDTLIVR